MVQIVIVSCGAHPVVALCPSIVQILYRYDELHPSEQTERNIAREIAEVIEGKQNQWTRWLA